MTITLIGYRATGKTTVGQHLAARLGWEFIDTDREIESVAGKSIAAIFKDDGEPHFRELESQQVNFALRKKNAVVSTGGGAVMNPASRELMQAAGPVIWLMARVPTIIQRLQSDIATAQSRPALTDAGLVEEVSAVLNVRNPVYAAMSTLAIPTDGRETSVIVDEILAAVGIQRGFP